MYLRLSWRNLWRDKKRTIIAACSVFFAVLLAVVMRSAQTGSYAYMVGSSAGMYTGYLQIQGDDYWENRSLDKSIVLSQATTDSLERVPNLTSVTPRLEAFALVAREANTKVAQVVGVDPIRENAMTRLKEKLVEGDYLDKGSDAVLIGQGLAEILGLEIGDSVVIYGQGYHGQTAAARLPVGGMVKLPFPAMNNSMMFLTLTNAQEIFSAYNRITSAAIMTDNVNHVPAVTAGVRGVVDDRYTIMTWNEMMPDLVQGIELDNASGIVMLLILYIVIAFGVFGTVMMMTSERAREFGILVSLGMNKARLVLVTTLETIQISFLGAIAGFLGSLPLIHYLHNNPLHMTGDAARAYESFGVEPIMNFSTNPHLFVTQSLVVLLIALAAALYPVLFISRLKPAKAIHR